MDQIITSLLTGQRTVILNGITIELQPLKRDTQPNREREAQKRAKEIIKLIS